MTEEAPVPTPNEADIAIGLAAYRAWLAADLPTFPGTMIDCEAVGAIAAMMVREAAGG